MSTASDPIQDNGSADDDVAHYWEPVHASTQKASRRKRQVTTPNDSAAPKRRKKIIKVGFDGRCHQLLRFKVEFGHCNIPQAYPAKPSLG